MQYQHGLDCVQHLNKDNEAVLNSLPIDKDCRTIQGMCVEPAAPITNATLWCLRHPL